MSDQTTMYGYTQIGGSKHNVYRVALAYYTSQITDIIWNNDTGKNIPCAYTDSGRFYRNSMVSFSGWTRGDASLIKYNMSTDTVIDAYYPVPHPVTISINTFVREYSRDAWRYGELKTSGNEYAKLIAADIEGPVNYLEINSIGVLLYEYENKLHMCVDNRYALNTPIRLSYISGVPSSEENILYGEYTVSSSEARKLDQYGGFTNILLLNSANELLTSRYLGNIIPFTHIDNGQEHVDKITVRVSSHIYSESKTELDVSYILDYSDHINNAKSGLSREHIYFDRDNMNLTKFRLDEDKNIRDAVNGEFPQNDVQEGTDFSEHEFDPKETRFFYDSNKALVSSGRGYTYSQYIWYYWYYRDLNIWINKFLGSSNQSILNKPSIDHPSIGFDGRHGSFLYDLRVIRKNEQPYIMLCVAGSNNYSYGDILIAPAPEELAAATFHTHKKDGVWKYRTKVNRFYDCYYFCYAGKAYYIKYNSDGMKTDRSIQPLSGVFSGRPLNMYEYTIRYFPNCTCSNFLQDFTSLHSVEFSDIGDVLINCPDDPSLGHGEGDLYFVSPIDKYSLLSDNGVGYVRVMEKNALDDILNPYLIDHKSSQGIIRAMYYYAAQNLWFLNKHGYKVLTVNSDYALGYSSGLDSYIGLGNSSSLRSRFKHLVDGESEGQPFLNGRHAYQDGYYRNIFDDEHGPVELNLTDGTGDSAGNFVDWNRGVLAVSAKGYIENGEDEIGVYRYFPR